MLENTNHNKEGYLFDIGDICYCRLSLCVVVMCGWKKLQLKFSVLLCVCDYDKGKDSNTENINCSSSLGLFPISNIL